MAAKHSVSNSLKLASSCAVIDVVIVVSICYLLPPKSSIEIGGGKIGLTLHYATQARAHYAAARELIDETGYHRRDGELREIADALKSRKAT